MAGTVLYDRASRLRVREDEAHRLAEHLATASNVILQRSPEERSIVVQRLSSKYFTVRWSLAPPLAPPMSADLFEMREQIIAWEPSLANHGLQLYLREPGRHSVVMGNFRLADGSWLTFKAPQLVDEHKFRIGWIAMMLGVAIALGLIALLMIRWTLRPLRRLSAAAARIGHGEQESIPEMGGDEVRGLIRAFNEMQARIHSLIEDRTEALAAVGHDLRTPLSRIQLRSDEIDDPDLRKAMAGDIREMGGMVSSLLAYLGGDNDPEQPQRVDIAVMAETLVDEVIDAGHAGLYEGPMHLDVTLRPIGFKRALRNIVENAAKYGENVLVTLTGPSSDKWIDLTVEDDGPGIAPEHLSDVLRPFVRLDPARSRDTKGLGLGLAIAARAIEREGGEIMLANRPKGGLRVHIRLPIRDEAPTQQ